MATRTLQALRQWSCSQEQLPPIEDIKSVVVIDFDNTLFQSPMPNRHIWDGSTINRLQGEDTFVSGGWWHDPSITKELGAGEDVEVGRSWEGWWNEQVVKAARDAISDSDTLTVLMTGRRRDRFGEIIQKILKSKDLRFDMVVLKQPVFANGVMPESTANFKNLFFETCLETYTSANELCILEDRPKQARAFEQHLESLNQRWGVPGARGAVHVDVMEIDAVSRGLDPTREIQLVKRMMNSHNTAMFNGTAPSTSIPYIIQSDRIYTGYLIPEADSARLLSYVSLPPDSRKEDYRILSDNIMISFRPPTPHNLQRAGGRGAQRRWRVTHLGVLNKKMWAVRVASVDRSQSVWTESVPPHVILAHGRGVPTKAVNSIKNWLPVEGGIEFDSKVGDKVLLRLVEDRAASYPAKDNNGTNHNTAAYGQNNRLSGYGQPMKRRLDSSHQQDDSRRPAPPPYQQRAEQSSADDGSDPDFPPLGTATQGPSFRRVGGGGGGAGGGGGPGRYGTSQRNAGGRTGQGRNAAGGNTGGGGRGRSGAGHGGRDGGGGGGGRSGQRAGGKYRSLDDAVPGASGYGDSGGMEY